MIVLTELSSLTVTTLSPRVRIRNTLLTLAGEAGNLRNDDDHTELRTLLASADDALHKRLRDLVLDRAILLSVRDAVVDDIISARIPDKGRIVTNKNWFSTVGRQYRRGIRAT